MAESQGRKGGVPNRQALYLRAAAHAFEAIDVLVKEMREGDNTAAKVGAAKTILAKCLPDLRAMEVSGDDKRPLLILDFKKYLEANRDNEPSAKTD